MDAQDRKEFAALMAGLWELYRIPVSESLLTVWWVAMEDLTLQQIRQGVVALLRDTSEDLRKRSYTLLPADIRSRVVRQRPAVVRAISDPRGKPNPDAMRSMREILQRVVK